ncbi:protein SNORC [Cyprinodon tularosa]|uniref:protein SNORC n=1 Tax=Cyprinodon tularosa TaxID=77115 RepID=UPI0018E2063A|nr:protein SNORC [Cyprinodon tularosa]
MGHSSICRVVLLLFSVLLALAHTETLLAASSRDQQDAMSGDPPTEVTTKNPFLDISAHTYRFEFEDSTHPPILDEDEGVLGAGAITAIVIAVFLGASVLLALIVITIRKFTAS